MPKINVVGCGHGSFVRFRGQPDEERYSPYPEGRSLATLKHAITLIETHIYKKKKHCNSYFKTLPKGHTFDAVWEDPSIWINYDHRVTGAYYGATNDSDTEITIYEDAFRRGHWWVVGTILHELAHVNGALGGNSIAAESCLKFCGLSALFDPSAVGGIFPVVNRDTGDRRV